MSTHQDPLIQKIFHLVETRFASNLISVYGIGSYFDDSLPSNWIKNDIDIVIFIESITNIPKEEWEQRFKPKKFIFKFSNYFFINFYTSIKEAIKSH